MKTEVIDWKTFMSGQYKRPTKLQIVVEHIERNKVVYRVAGVTMILLLSADVSAFASAAADVQLTSQNVVLASDVPAFAPYSGIDQRANAIYHGKLLAFGKWALIIKGGWGAIHKTIQEDFEGAKKTFFSYLVMYLMLLVFPWAMKEMDGMFS